MSKLGFCFPLRHRFVLSNDDDDDDDETISGVRSYAW